MRLFSSYTQTIKCLGLRFFASETNIEVLNAPSDTWKTHVVRGSDWSSGLRILRIAAACVDVGHGVSMTGESLNILRVSTRMEQTGRIG